MFPGFGASRRQGLHKVCFRCPKLDIASELKYNQRPKNLLKVFFIEITFRTVCDGAGPI